jgi:pantoate--beta-alanine ligase
MAAECDVAAVVVGGPEAGQWGFDGDFDADLALAEEAGAAVVFAPSRPFCQSTLLEEPVVRVGPLTEALEGAHRPGHLQRVATVVAKLLAIAGPCWAYFGERDYQRLVVVRRLVTDLSLPAVVVPCPTVRDPDGLALSSSNDGLSSAERRAAAALYWALLRGKRAIDEEGVRDASTVRAQMCEVLAREPLVVADYAEVREPETFEPVAEVTARVRLLVAARVGPARLIDNVAAGDGAGLALEAQQRC